MSNKIIVKEIVIEHTEERDLLVIFTLLPLGIKNHVDNAAVHLTLKKGTGESYCSQNFAGVPVRSIDASEADIYAFALNKHRQ